MISNFESIPIELGKCLRKNILGNMLYEFVTKENLLINLEITSIEKITEQH